MSQLIPFNDNVALPAHLLEGFDSASDLIGTGGGGYPSVSIKGKVFTLKRGDEKTLITRTNSDGEEEPARALEVVILKVFPAGKLFAKTYYEGGYTEGSDAKPVCYSNDGIAPGINATNPQCKTCAACPQNVLGSKITEDGKKTKACSDSKRLAIAPAGQLNDPYLLRVPFTSLFALSEMGETLAKRKVPYNAVVAKIGFDYTVAHPKLTFKPHAFLDAAGVAEVQEMKDSDIVQRIVGIVEDEYHGEADDSFETPKQKVAAAKPAIKKPVVEEDDPKPKVKVQVEDEEAPAPKKAAAKPAAKVQEVEEDLDAALDDMDFDD